MVSKNLSQAIQNDNLNGWAALSNALLNSMRALLCYQKLKRMLI